MSPHYISRVRFSRGRGSTGSLVDVLARKLVDYDTHQLLWGLFGADDGKPADRDFIFRAEGAGRDTVFTVVSSQAPKDSTGLFAIETKPYAPAIRAGMLLGFSVRAVPSVSVNRTNAQGVVRSLRMDPVARRFAELGEAGESFDRDVVRAEVLGEWLSGKAAASGFDIMVADVLRYQSVEHPKNRNATMPVVEFGGALRVRDVSEFEKTLVSGIGRGKSFGYGMMMVTALT